MIKKLKRYIKAITHYNRMIRWAKKQDKDRWALSSDMDEAIDERWYNVDCSYCLYHSNIFDFNCHLCELSESKEINLESIDCCSGLWGDMNNSEYWGDWVKEARKVRWYIIRHGLFG